MNNLDLLLRDYEIQMDAQRQRDYEADAAEVRRSEEAKITLADRLAAQMGEALVVQGANAETWRGTLKNLGLGWVQISQEAGDLLIPLHSILWWEGGNHRSYGAAQEVSRKLTLGYALRALSAAQQEVAVAHVGAESLVTEGRVLSVGADYCELLQLRSPAQRQTGRQGSRTIPFAAIAAIRVR